MTSEGKTTPFKSKKTLLQKIKWEQELSHRVRVILLNDWIRFRPGLSRSEGWEHPWDLDPSCKYAIPLSGRICPRTFGKRLRPLLAARPFLMCRTSLRLLPSGKGQKSESSCTRWTDERKHLFVCEESV